MCVYVGHEGGHEATSTHACLLWRRPRLSASNRNCLLNVSMAASGVDVSCGQVNE